MFYLKHLFVLILTLSLLCLPVQAAPYEVIENWTTPKIDNTQSLSSQENTNKTKINQAWFIHNELFLYQDGTPRTFWKINLQTRQRELLYHLQESESLLNGIQGDYAYFRSESSFKRLSLKTGKVEPWLPGYKALEINLNDTFDCNQIIGNVMLQINCVTDFRSNSPYHPNTTTLNIWDLEANQLKATYSVPARPQNAFLISHIMPYFGVGYVSESTGKPHFIIWDMRTGQQIIKREIDQRSTTCKGTFPENAELHSIVVNYLQDKTIQILNCDVLKGKVLQELRIKMDSQIENVFVIGSKFYIVDSKAKLQIYDQATGQLLEENTLFTKFIPGEYKLAFSVWQEQDKLIFKAQSYDFDKQSVKAFYFLKTGQFLLIEDQDNYLHQDSKGHWFSNSHELFYIPTGKWQNKHRQIEWQIKAFGDSLLLTHQDGHYLGFGNYQQHFHLQREGYTIPWNEAEQQFN